MAQISHVEGVAAGRLQSEEYDNKFADLHAPLDGHEAHVEADRCYFCYDAPCQTACPTDIDIPMFIREISTGNPLGAAKTIFDQNILGGMCARVCPTETLCEESCVRMEAEGKPVKIGQLQRFATDIATEKNKQFYERAAATGKKIAVVGAGPAGLACAHRLAVHGHDVTIFDAKEKPGGLNEYGIASYKSVDNFAQKEVDYILDIGGISLENGKKLGTDFTLESLTGDFDAVFLGIGLGAVNALSVDDQPAQGVVDAVDFISELRQTSDLSTLPIGQKVVVIGGGMTAIDAGIQAKLLGAEEVTICYRRGQEHMNASAYEQELAASKGVVIRHWLAPKKAVTKDDKLTGLVLEYTQLEGNKLVGTGREAVLEADQVFAAIGQALIGESMSAASVELISGRIKVDDEMRTTSPKIWAGGDCILGGEDLTVTATANGRDAAESINKALSA